MQQIKHNKTCRIFSGIGAKITIADIDISHRVQSRNCTQGQRHQPIICKFVRIMAPNKTVVASNNINQESADDLGLSSSSEIGQVRTFRHLTSRLQKLLYLAESHQTSYNYKHCWAKESTIFLRKTDGSRVTKLGTEENLREQNNCADKSEGPC